MFLLIFSPRLLEQRRLAPLLRVRRFGFPSGECLLVDAELRFGFLLGLLVSARFVMFGDGALKGDGA